MNGFINGSVYPDCGVHWLILTCMIVVFLGGGGCFSNLIRYESYEHGFGLFL